jgi:predicted dehydrogenase
MKLKACIVGLGQVGVKFDLEKERSNSQEIWTHFSAYQSLDQKYEIVAVVDPDKSTWKYALQRNVNVRCFSSIESLLESNVVIDVASICSPDKYHYLGLKLLANKIKGIFIEKPISLIHETEVIKSFITNNLDSTAIYVNYYKRLDPSIKKMISTINSNDETIKYLDCKYSGPFMAVGSHAVDLLNFILPVKGIKSVFKHISKEGDGYSAMMHGFNSELINLSYTGKRHEFIFEIDLITNKSRYQLTENLINYNRAKLVISDKYLGYKEYFEATNEFLKNNSRFVSYLEDLYSHIRNGKGSNENLKSSLDTQVLMKEIMDSENL